jgi:pimeloyl-ACP methyl ester carboxylesterase
MTMRTILAAAFVLLIGFLLIGFLVGQEPGPSPPNVPGKKGWEDSRETVDRSKPQPFEAPQFPRDTESKAKSAFININGVKHHYLDWGGNGETVLLLAGLGNTAHIFESFGSALANDHRVLALTRRGHGQSDSPMSGYDTATRVEDIRAFLDSLGITNVALIGHSIAGDEITLFSAKYPERTKAAIYIDAGYDRRMLKQLNARNPLRITFPRNLTHSYQNYVSFMRASEPALNEFWQQRVADFDAQIKRLNDGSVEVRTSPKIYAHYHTEMSRFHADYRRVRAPVVAIYATSEKHPAIPTFIGAQMREQAHRFWKDVRMPFAREQIRMFQEALPDATVIELEETDHFCFISREVEVIAHIRSFLEPIDQQGKE